MTEKSTLQILTEARALITDRTKWWDGGPDSQGRHCAITACLRVVNHTPECADAISAISRQVDVRSTEPDTHHLIAQFNDTHTHAEVLALFDQTIEAERAKSRQAAIDSMLTDANSAPAPARKTKPTKAEHAPILSAP